ncbi:hypothetical protein F4823DRAFT_589693 [Ustulina deusta]|nr:hypothetical protein F4823DRAFT_589693 [Ustulina deusta]
MAPDSFHQFASLPLELRWMIYILASPPRFVHVQEETEDWEYFEERFRTTIVQIKLHPSIAYFARHWRERIPFPPALWRWNNGRHQTTLERYGFNGPRPNQNHQPWVSTKEVPGIPRDFLLENPDVAWEFLRIGAFYSTAPIPAMLHVTRESRQVLIDYGYELAFGTRTCGPRTWFNFKTDALYIGRLSDRDSEDRSTRSLLSGNSSWDIGQFEPQDLRRVRRLALESSADVVSSDCLNGTREISNILELFNGVEELLLEEHSMRGINHELSKYVQPDDSQLLWYYTPVLEVDVLPLTIEGSPPVLDSTGYGRRDLRSYKADNMGDGSKFFVDTARRFEEKLASRRDELVRSSSLAPWKIPKISLVCILQEWMCRALFEWRWDIWNRYQGLKKEESRSKAAEEARRSIDVPRKPIYEKNDNEDSPPSQFSEEFRDDIEAYEELIDDEYRGYSGFDEDYQQHS